MQLHILEPAVEELEKLDKSVGRRVVKRILWLAANIDSITPEPLTGDFAGLYKLVRWRLSHFVRHFAR